VLFCAAWQDAYKPDVDHIVTAASCTTNCLAPVVKVVHERLGIKHGCITTIHNLTNTQTIVDAPNTKKSDLRRARWVLAQDCLLTRAVHDGVDTLSVSSLRLGPSHSSFSLSLDNNCHRFGWRGWP